MYPFISRCKISKIISTTQKNPNYPNHIHEEKKRDIFLHISKLNRTFALGWFMCAILRPLHFGKN